MNAVHGIGSRLNTFSRLLLAAMVVMGVTATSAIVASTPAFAAGAPTIGQGYGAFENNPVINLTGCTGTSSSTTLTCTSDPLTAGVTVGMGVYGLDLNGTTPNSVAAVTATTVGLTADPSAAVTAGATETFTNNSAMANVSGSTSSTTLTDTTDWYYYGIDVGMEVYGAGIAPDTTVVTAATKSTSLVLSQDPTASLSGETIFFNPPDTNDALTLVTGGAANVNTSSLVVVSQPPADDGYVVAKPSSTHGLVAMYPALNPVDNSFSATLAYCAPTYTYPAAGECTTFTMTYTLATGQDMGDQLSILDGAEIENIYENAASAWVGPTTATQGQTVTLISSPVGSSIPTTSGGATVTYIDGDTSITPVPQGFTYVPGSAKLSGGDATTEGATTAEYCTAAGTGCTAQINTGNYKTTYPYLEEQLGTASADEAAGGALQTLPTLSASFVATGAAGTSANTYLTEFLVDTEVNDILNVAVDFDGYPTSGATPYCSSSCTYGASTAAPPYVAPSPIDTVTILPSVTGTSTPNGSDSGPTSGGSPVTVTGTGFTGASQVYFGSNPATSFTVNSNTSISAVAPASTTGTGPVDVTVVNGGQTSPIAEPADQFTYGPPTAPDTPTNVVATPDNGQAEIYWTPGFNEGSPTQNYTVTATDITNPGTDGDQTTCQSDVPPEVDTCTITGLTNGDSYTFSVTATNGIGTSASSVPSAAITVGTPQAPTGVSATGAQNGSAPVTWTDPTNTGGSPIVDDTVTASPGGAQCTYEESAGPPAGCTVVGLTNGTSYTFSVTATNANGTGPASAPSTAVVPSTVPGAPTIGTATSNANASSAVSFTAPASNGGAAISSYTVTAVDTTNPSNPNVTQSGTGSPITVSGLNNGDTYSFSVTATNVSGTGASSGSTTATPSTAPGAPTNVTAAVGPPVATGDAAVSWTAPASNGGATITTYTVTSSTGSKTCTSTSTAPATPATTCTVTGLTNGTNYTFTVTAKNASGTSAASVAGPVGGVVPSAVPATPTAPTVTTAGLAAGTASVTWAAPANEGSTLTQYTLTPTPACPACTGLTVTGAPPAASTTVGGLTDGTSYTFTLIAANGDGNSAASPSSTAEVVGIPAAPTGVTGVPTSTSGQTSVSWAAGASLSGTITGYTLTPSPACSACTGLTVTGSPAATSTTVGGLTNGTSYTFTVKETNASGTSAASTASTGVVTGSPTAPTGVVAVGGIPAPSGDLNVTWAAPSSSGVGTINSYTATAKPSSGSSKTCTSTSTAPATPTLACQVTGATNGTSYTVTVTATNSAGTAYVSVASAASAAAFPSTTFGAPTIGTATAGNQSAVVKWTAPTALAGTQPALTGYTVTPYIGSTAQTPQTFNNTGTTETVTGLTPLTAYTFTVAAINANGTGTASAKSAAATPNGPPAAPTGASATAGNQSADVTWTDGSSNGSTTLSYTVTATDTSTVPLDPQDGNETCTYTVPVGTEVDSCNVTGLANGDSYTFAVTATNADGTGPASGASNSVTPSTVPDAPTGVDATPGAQSATVTWTDGFNEGSPTASYTVTATDTSASPRDPQDGNETCTYTVPAPPATEVDSCTVTGLANGDSYTFAVTATNADGTGAASAASNSVTPSSVPDAPTAVSAVAHDTSAKVSWTDGFNEGSTTLFYTVTATDTSASPLDPNDGGETCTYTVPAPPATEVDACHVHGLANGDSYTFSVTATNANGTGAASNPSNTIVPSTVPDAPVGVNAAPGEMSATVTWTDGFNEGSTVVSYKVTATDTSTNPLDPNDGGETCTYTVPAPPATEVDSCAVTGLANGDTYTFTVTATNADGTGPASAPSNTITPAAVPDAPTAVSATGGDQSATVTWTDGFDEGSTTQSYTVTATDTSAVPLDPTDGGETCTYTVPAPPATEVDSCDVTGLTNGDSYTFAVTATNANGTGAASNPSNAVVPSTVPDAPTGASALAGNTVATVSWTAPASDNGAGITKYTVTSTPGGKTCTATSTLPASPSTTCEITGLSNGTSYTFTVTATNIDGTGPASSHSGSVIPSTVPDAPTGASATPGNQSATVSWTVPNDQGRSILSYTVTATDLTHAFNGGQTVTGLADPATVSGLTNGDSYTFTVVATNADGTGAASTPSNAVTPTALVPVAVTSASSTAVAAGKQVSFRVTANGYPLATITKSGAPTWLKLKATTGTSTSVAYKMSGKAPATSGGAHTFTIEASNGVSAPVYQTFTVNVLEITSPNTTSASVSHDAAIDVTTSDTPANPVLSVSGLPAGLSFRDNGNGTGVIYGTTTARVGSKHYAMISATSGSKVAKQRLKITVTS
jgi:titin